MKNKKKYAFVLLFQGPIGGAQKRFINLVNYLNDNKMCEAKMIVSDNLYVQIKSIYQLDSYVNYISIDSNFAMSNLNGTTQGPKIKNEIKQVQTFKIIKNSCFYKLFYYYRSLLRQRKVFRKIDSIVCQHNIESLIGVFSGITPLYFYLSSPIRPGVIFSNMDSWFSNISKNPKKTGIASTLFLITPMKRQIMWIF
jgi:hypothetical protein